MPTTKPARGRPRKYGRPSRAVTFTLPEDVLSRLSVIDTDVGRAIVSLVEHQRRPQSPAVRHAEIARYGNHAVIVVNPANVLKRLPGVELVPIGNGRALISLGGSHSIVHLELAVRDALEAGSLSHAERDTLEALAAVLRRARLTRGVSIEQRTIIVLARNRPPRAGLSW
jgi:hypothetical protein